MNLVQVILAGVAGYFIGALVTLITAMILFDRFVMANVQSDSTSDSNMETNDKKETCEVTL